MSGSSALLAFIVFCASPISSPFLNLNLGAGLGDLKHGVGLRWREREFELLQVRQLRTKEAGLIADGGNLYLRTFKRADDTLARSWTFRFRLPGQRERDMGLGSLDSIGLAKARELAAAARELVAQGIDPIERRDELHGAIRAEQSRKAAIPTFDECARDYIAVHRASWKNPKHAAQWWTTILGEDETGKKTKHNYCAALQKLRVNEITADHVHAILKPVWHTKTETASRVRNRIEMVLDFAKANHHRDGENPAKWGGNLKHRLASPKKIAKVKHHGALPFREIGSFMAHLRQRDGIAALALEFTILTCARTSETVGGTWDEIDSDVWTIPADRIKNGKEHQVPLSKAAMAVLHKVREITTAIGGPVGASKLIFPNDVTGRQLSESGMSAVLKRMGQDVTVHGFRSTFRDWAGEVSNFPSELAELALSHTVGTKTELAYKRGTGFQKRRVMAEAWAGYCGKIRTDGEVLRPDFSAQKKKAKA